MKRFFPLLLAFSLLTACQPKKPESPESMTTVSFDPNGFVEKECGLEEIFAEIDYVVLESLPESLFGHFMSCIPGENYLLLLTSDKLLLFGPDGKFVRTISEKGQGPGEFFGPISCMLLEDKNEIHLQTNTETLVFSLEGELLRSHPMVPARSHLHFVRLNAGEIVADQFRGSVLTGRKVTALFRYSAGDYRLLDSLPSRLPKKLHLKDPEMYIFMTTLSNQPDGYYFKETFGDTVYNLHEDFTLSPAYLFDYGPYKLLEDNVYKYKNFRKESREQIFLYYFMETQRGYLTGFFRFRDAVHFFYTRPGEEPMYLAGAEIDGERKGGYSLEAFPGEVYQPRLRQGKYALVEIPAYLASERVVKTRGMSEEVFQKIKGLDENDNPVIVLLK